MALFFRYLFFRLSCSNLLIYIKKIAQTNTANCERRKGGSSGPVYMKFDTNQSACEVYTYKTASHVFDRSSLVIGPPDGRGWPPREPFPPGRVGDPGRAGPHSPSPPVAKRKPGRFTELFRAQRSYSTLVDAERAPGPHLPPTAAAWSRKGLGGGHEGTTADSTDVIPTLIGDPLPLPLDCYPPSPIF